MGGARGGLTNTYTAPGTTVPPDFFAADAIAISAGASNGFRETQLTYGLQAGYNYQFNNIVLGVEVDFNRLGLKKAIRNTFPTPFAGTIVSNTNLDLPWLFTARPRLGLSFDRALVYVTGGLAVTRPSLSQTVVFDPAFSEAGPDTVSLSQTKTGWAVGGGGEFAIAGNWSVKAEYLYVHFDSISTTTFAKSPFFGNPTLIAYGHRLDIDRIQIGRVGLNYKFGGPVYAAY